MDIDIQDRCMVREPLFPIGKLFSVGRENDPRTKTLDELIQEFLADTHFMEGLYWSSSELYQEVVKYREGKLSQHKQARLEKTLLKYIIRSCMRCTPFGVLAGVYTASFSLGGKSCTDNRKLVRHTRVDMAFWCQLLDNVVCGDSIRKLLGYYINNTVYKHDNQYRYIEPIVNPAGKIGYEISAMKCFPFLSKLLQNGKRGMVNYASLKNLLHGEGVKDDAEVTEIFNVLVQNKILMPETESQLTSSNDYDRGKRILLRLAEQSGNESIIESKVNVLRKTDNVLQILDGNAVGAVSLDMLQNLCQTIAREMPHLPSESLFHNDLEVIYSDMVVSQSVRTSIGNAVATMYSIASPEDADSLWTSFQKVFEERYGTEEIPLTTLLDPDMGIGFPASESIGSGYNALQRKPKSNAIHDYLRRELERICFTETKGLPVIKLEQNTAGKHIIQSESNVPFSVFASIYPGGTIVIHSIGGANATALLGRFGYVNEECQRLCESVAALETFPASDHIVAEVVHLPGSARLGNIARRLPLSEYEIPLLSPSSKPFAFQVTLEDLMVSIRNNKVVLRSKRLNKKVVPRLSNAHNYLKSDIPAYKFLCTVAQQESLPSLGVRWDGSFGNYTILPRVEAAGVIVSRAEWRIGKESRTSVLKSSNPTVTLRSELNRLKVPRFALLVQGDNELLLDLVNDLYLELLLDEIRKSELVRLCEWPEPMADSLSNYRYVRQVVVPMSMGQLPVNRSSMLPAMPGKEIKVARSFPPGSEWVYFKIYLSANDADDVLVRHIYPILQSLEKSGQVLQYFFLRYNDPHHHIRLRLQLKQHFTPEEWGAVVVKLTTKLGKLKAQDKLWKWQLDCYERELERYGLATIEATEQAFHTDSLAILHLLKKRRKEDIPSIFNGVILVDAWLDVFSLGIEEKIRFCRQRIDAFLAEFGKEAKYGCEVEIRQNGWIHLLARYCSKKTGVEKLYRKIDACKLRTENLADYIHISLNRWYTDGQRMEEFRTFILAGKYYAFMLNDKNKKQ
ncbi:MAG: lantibiotic dehydratase [Chitinophagaceae bacterium]